MKLSGVFMERTSRDTADTQSHILFAFGLAFSTRLLDLAAHCFSFIEGF